MKNLIIGVKSCAQDVFNGANDAIRETWAKHLNNVADLRFFVGDGTFPTSGDEIRVGAPDGYYGLPDKTKAILKWMLHETSYEFICLVDTDTYLRPPRLYTSGYEAFDIMGYFAHRQLGRFITGENCWASPSGAHYVLSRKAAEVVANAPRTNDWAEDHMIGQLLGPFVQRGLIKAVNNPLYAMEAPQPDSVSIHYCAYSRRRSYSPTWMAQTHLFYKDKP